MHTHSPKCATYFARVLGGLLVAVVCFYSLPAARAESKRTTGLTNQMRAGHSPFSQTVKIELPDGPGKEQFQRACTMCHAGQQISRVNWGRQDWEDAVHAMVGWGAPLDKEEIPVLVEYLAKNFDGGTRAPGKVVPGPVKATLENFDMPTPNSLPHDSWFSGGQVWITEMSGQALASFNPKTKKFKEYTMRPDTDPKTVVSDNEGNLWFAPDLAGFIGKLDPKTGKVKEYTVPGPKIELHDIAVDQKGIIWFCILNPRPPRHPAGSKIGRLDPKTGKFQLIDTPTPNASPYGVVVSAEGIPYYTTNQSNILGKVDPVTLKITEYRDPNPDTRMKRLTITPDGSVYFTDYKRGYLHRFDPKTEKFSEWASPSGPLSYPYGIDHVNDVVWYVEAQSNPNMLVRFDTKTEKFQTWAVTSGGGLKHVHAQDENNLWLTRPLTNGITHVSLAK